MLTIAEKIKKIEEGPGNFVQVPKELWDALLEAIEEYGLLKAMDEAEDSPSLSGEDALTYLQELESNAGKI
jgi:hypothetical protein